MVEEISATKYPQGLPQDGYSCKDCLREHSGTLVRLNRLIEVASKALSTGVYPNEVELSNGGLKVHLVRFAPSPMPFVCSQPCTGTFGAMLSPLKPTRKEE